MAYVAKEKKYDNTPNFLKSAHFTAFTYTVTKAMGDEDGIVKAGTIIPANNSTAKGILVNDVYVGEGDQPGALIVEGYILKDRLPKVPVAEAITALKEIKFY